MWNLEELRKIYELPLFALLSQAHLLHIQNFPVGEVQVCTIINIKEGGCPEDCKYCTQSSRYQTSIKAQPMLSYEEVMVQAEKAMARGVTRICLGAAWREVRDGKQFNEILCMVRGITSLGIEVCCTLGMVTDNQAAQLKSMGLYAYNHNLDSSESFYKTIITTRSYQERLKTLSTIQRQGLSVCCGGILGMGETVEDRLQLLLTLIDLKPDSLPLNRLSPMVGTPLENQSPISSWEHLRLIATTRIVLPETLIRLSSGRAQMSLEEQTLCFFAGANSIHAGEKLLTVANTPLDVDEQMFQLLGLKKRAAFS